MRKTADISITTGTEARMKFIIRRIKYPESLIKSVFFAIFFAIEEKVWHSTSVYEKTSLFSHRIFVTLPVFMGIYRRYRRINLYA